MLKRMPFVKIQINGVQKADFEYLNYDEEKMTNLAMAIYSKTKESKGTEVIKLISVPTDAGYTINIVTKKITKWQRFKRKIGL